MLPRMDLGTEGGSIALFTHSHSYNIQQSQQISQMDIFGNTSHINIKHSHYHKNFHSFST